MFKIPTSNKRVLIKGDKVNAEAFRQWISRDDTGRMLDLEHIWLQEKLSVLRGYCLMYQGVDTDRGSLKYSPVPHKFTMGLGWQRNIITADAFMDADQWPFPDQSVDVVILQHSLDFCQRPHQMIREATRVLNQDGSLILIGFNPWSWLGGVRALVPFSSGMFSLANMIRIGRLKDWLTLLDYSLEECSTSGYVWPLPFIKKQMLLNVDKNMTSSSFMTGSSYMLVAKKNTRRLTGINSRSWRPFQPQYGWASDLAASDLTSPLRKDYTDRIVSNEHKD